MWSVGRRCPWFLAALAAAVGVLWGSPPASFAQAGGHDALPEGARLIEGDTTATSETYALPNGHLLTRVYLYPVNGRDAKGKWQPLSEAAYARDSESANSLSQSPAMGGLSPDAERPSGQEDETSCSISSSAPTTSECNEKTFEVGYESAGEVKRRGLIYFVLPQRHEEQIVLNAQLELYAGSTTTSNTGAMGVYRATEQWENTATWDTRNGESSWETPGGAFAEGGANDWINSSVGASKGWVYWYPTRLVQEWYAAGPDVPTGEWQHDDGFLIKYANEGSTNNVVSFDGREEREHDPQLSIESVKRGVGDNSLYTNLTIPISGSQSLSVNPASGDLMIHSTDFSIPDNGFEFVSARNWNSLASEAPGYGYGWVDTNAVYIEPFKGSGAVAYTDGTGSTFPFIKEGANFVTPPGIEATMCAAGSSSPCPEHLPTGTEYQLIYTKTGDHIDFKGKKSEDFPINVVNAAGQTLIAGYGTAIEEPISWTDSEGTKIAYSATYEQGYTKITNEGTKQSALYTETKGADVIDHLTKYTSMSGEATSYAYGAEYLEGNQLQKITEPDGEVIKLTYGEGERIAKVERLADAEATTGATTTYTYYQASKAPAPCTPEQKGTLVAGPEMEGEAPQQTLYCSNVLDEVEGGTNLSTATGQPGWYALIEEANGESASAAVNVASGNLFVQDEDLIPSEASGGVGLDRYYNSLAPSSQTKGLGPRWSWGVGPEVYLAFTLFNNDKIALHGPNGYVVALQRSGRSYTAPEEFEGVLTENENGTYTLSETEEGDTYQFNESGVMTSYSNQEGKTFTVTDKTTDLGEKLLQTVTPAGGKPLEFSYSSTPRHVSEVKSPNGNTRKYAYNSEGQLSSFTNPSGEKTEYEYTSGYLSKIKTPNGTVETITSDKDGRVTEVSISKTGEAVHGYKFSYQDPVAPTCNPATDAGETIVTKTPEVEGATPEAYCYDALGQITSYPASETEQEEEEGEGEGGPFQEQREVAGTNCSEEPQFTTEECEPNEFSIEEGATNDALASPDSPVAPAKEVLEPKQFGIAEGNSFSAYDAFNKATFVNLEVKYLRLVTPWNIAYEAKREEGEGRTETNGYFIVELKELQDSIKAFRADNSNGVVILSLEHCNKLPTGEAEAKQEAEVEKEEKEQKVTERSDFWRNPESGKEWIPCDTVPNENQYRADIEVLLKAEAVDNVQAFTAWNEPNNTKKGSKNTEPETGKPKAATAGKYWNVLSKRCKLKARKCEVAAGDFADNHLPEANNEDQYGGKYLEEYKKALDEKPTAWAFHTYYEGEHIIHKSKIKQPSTWWSRFNHFVKGVDDVTKESPPIWLTEQGVQYTRGGVELPPYHDPKVANEIMDAYVSEENAQNELVNQSPQIKMFLYYEMRGTPLEPREYDYFDSGLIEPEQRGKPETPEKPRSIYYIYGSRTPGKPKKP